MAEFTTQGVSPGGGSDRPAPACERGRPGAASDGTRSGHDLDDQALTLLDTGYAGVPVGDTTPQEVGAQRNVQVAVYGTLRSHGAEATAAAQERVAGAGVEPVARLLVGRPRDHLPEREEVQLPRAGDAARLVDDGDVAVVELVLAVRHAERREDVRPVRVDDLDLLVGVGLDRVRRTEDRELLGRRGRLEVQVRDDLHLGDVVRARRQDGAELVGRKQR